MPKLSIVQVVAAPLREISGLCTRTVSGRAELLAIGDEEHVVLSCEIADGAHVGERFERHDVRRFVPPAHEKKGSQWEGIAADGEGRVLVLEETPGRVFVLPASLDAVAAVIELAVDEEALRGRAWQRDENSRGEGLVPLANGHLLVVKEKRPALLVEFGPAGMHAEGARPELFSCASFPVLGERYVPLATWLLDGGPEDLSDAAVAPDGALWLVSDAERCLLRLEPRLVPMAGPPPIGARWELPKKIDKPEGLAFLPGGSPVVACDRDDDTPALYVLERI